MCEITCINRLKYQAVKIMAVVMAQYMLLIKRNWIWDIIEIDWKNVNMTLNGNIINLPCSVVIPLREKFRMRKLLRRQPWYFHVMLKQWKT